LPQIFKITVIASLETLIVSQIQGFDVTKSDGCPPHFHKQATIFVLYVGREVSKEYAPSNERLFLTYRISEQTNTPGKRQQITNQKKNSPFMMMLFHNQNPKKSENET